MIGQLETTYSNANISSGIEPLLVKATTLNVDALLEALATLKQLQPYLERVKEVQERRYNPAAPTTPGQSKGVEFDVEVVKALKLTRREVDALRFCLEGYTAGHIAERLAISKRTVESHLQNAYGKLDVNSKPEMMAKVRQVGLIRPW